MRPIRRFATAALCGVILLGAPAPALAREEGPARRSGHAGDEGIEAVKARAQEAIRRRTRALDAAVGRLAAAGAVSDDHRRTLTADLEAVKAGLADLSARIAEETDPTALRALVRDIEEDFYVFRFQLPRVRLVVGSDRALAVADRLSAVADRLESAVERRREAGHDVGDAEAALASLRAQVATAAGLARAAGASVIALDVSGHPGNATVLAAAREDLAAARRDAAAVLAALRSTPRR